MYTPARSAAAMINSPLRALNGTPLTVTATASGSSGGVSLRGAATSVMPGSAPCRHDGDRGSDRAAGDACCEVLREQRHRRVDRDVRRRADEADRGHLVRERHGAEAEPLAGGVRHRAGADRLADLE